MTSSLFFCLILLQSLLCHLHLFRKLKLRQGLWAPRRSRRLSESMEEIFLSARTFFLFMPFSLLSYNLRELTLGYSCCHVLVSKTFRRNFILITVAAEILATFRSDNEYEIDDEYDFSIPSRKRVLSCMTPISFLEPHSILFNNAEERGTR